MENDVEDSNLGIKFEENDSLEYNCELGSFMENSKEFVEAKQKVRALARWCYDNIKDGTCIVNICTDRYVNYSFDVNGDLQVSGSLTSVTAVADFQHNPEGADVFLSKWGQ